MLLCYRSDDKLETEMLTPTYSRRRRQQESSKNDVYEYDLISDKVRVQVVQILRSGMGSFHAYGYEHSGRELYRHIVREMRREVGVHELVQYASDEADELFKFIEFTPSVETWLDAVEYCLRGIDYLIRQKPDDYKGRDVRPDDAIDEFNARLQEAALGYQFVSPDIVRIDSQLMHKEAVLPVLILLNQERFAAAEQEYRSAHHAFRNRELEDCIVDCGKAFESVLKIIGSARRWPIKNTDSASKLIQAAVTSGFIAPYTSTSLNHLKGLLESSTPTVRNKEGGHGAGTVPRSVSPELAALQLHQTAAMILYLAQRDAALTAAGE
ncbi:hypothetical protein MKK68_16590 [Methylobacterium sp. E-016]|uniref:STM4504/CBY_0614 family protein n=1 Tax=Methylobacterium sp. E-016 TaxID=2836556 RepID=UPI001FB878BC|nr:hypothetical protein [Methylobacterium sp. E-016]MCJ2077245.1 hypothetical protein [Methylobacterium sp. E-016]